MSIRYFALMFLGIAVVHAAAHAQTKDSGLRNAVVENIRYENPSKVAYVTIENRSGKDITAFNLSLDVSYSNGKSDHFEHTTDLLPGIVSSASEPLHSGQSYEVRIDAPPDTKLVSVKPTLDLIVYADLSSETKDNRDALGRLIHRRKSESAAEAKAAEIINAVAADGVTPDPVGMAIHELRQFADQQKSSHSADLSETELLSSISDLENQSRKTAFEDKQTGHQVSDHRSADIEFLRGYASRKNKIATTVSAHTAIKGGL